VVECQRRNGVGQRGEDHQADAVVFAFDNEIADDLLGGIDAGLALSIA
jgi:hypothetical protein